MFLLFHYLRLLRLILQSLPLRALTTLVHALICARIDNYGKSVYTDLYSSNACKLQATLNAARLVWDIHEICQYLFLHPSLHSRSPVYLIQGLLPHAKLPCSSCRGFPLPQGLLNTAVSSPHSLSSLRFGSPWLSLGRVFLGLSL